MTTFVISNELNTPARTIDTLRQPRLWVPTAADYPSHDQWLEKTEADLISGRKQAMTVQHDEADIGVVVYQRHPEASAVCEIKNISIMPQSRGRHIGSFTLRTAEVQAINDFPGIETLEIDTKLTNKDMITFLQLQGYVITKVADVYDSGMLDVVLTKPAAI